MAYYTHGTKTVTTTASMLLNTAGASEAGVLLQNRGSVDVYVGGPGVTADNTATGGFKITAGTTQLIPTSGGAACDLWAVAASSSASVGFLVVTWQ